jgi:hypothetical protein
MNFYFSHENSLSLTKAGTQVTTHVMTNAEVTWSPGEYSFQMQRLSMIIRFRLLSGTDGGS